MTPTLVSQSEFAAIIGVHKSRVSRMKDAGKLVMVGGKVDVEASQAKITATAERNTAKADDAASGKKLVKGDSTLTSERTRNERAKADKAELELQVMRGELVNAEEARLFAADLGATFRSAVEVRSDRLCSELAPLTDPEAIRAVLIESDEQMLGDIADKILKWGKV